MRVPGDGCQETGAGRQFRVFMLDVDIAVIRFYNRLYQGSKKPWYCRAKVLSG